MCIAGSRPQSTAHIKQAIYQPSLVLALRASCTHVNFTCIIDCSDNVQKETIGAVLHRVSLFGLTTAERAAGS